MLKTKMFNLLKVCLFAVAVFAAATPSQFGSYQPETPEKLKEYKL